MLKGLGGRAPPVDRVPARERCWFGSPQHLSTSRECHQAEYDTYHHEHSSSSPALKPIPCCLVHPEAILFGPYENPRLGHLREDKARPHPDVAQPPRTRRSNRARISKAVHDLTLSEYENKRCTHGARSYPTTVQLALHPSRQQRTPAFIGALVEANANVSRSGDVSS